MTQKHTPGPWHMEPLQGGHQTIMAADGAPITSPYPFASPKREGQEMANARLIAAAPELLEALEALYGDACSMSCSDELLEGMARASAAIAKATGKET